MNILLPKIFLSSRVRNSSKDPLTLLPSNHYSTASSSPSPRIGLVLFQPPEREDVTKMMRRSGSIGKKECTPSDSITVSSIIWFYSTISIYSWVWTARWAQLSYINIYYCTRAGHGSSGNSLDEWMVYYCMNDHLIIFPLYLLSCTIVSILCCWVGICLCRHLWKAWYVMDGRTG